MSQGTCKLFFLGIGTLKGALMAAIGHIMTCFTYVRSSLLWRALGSTILSRTQQCHTMVDKWVAGYGEIIYMIKNEMIVWGKKR
jgi:hypothetical protein